MCIETNLSFSAKSELDRRLIGDYYKDGTVLLIVFSANYAKLAQVCKSGNGKEGS